VKGEENKEAELYNWCGEALEKVGHCNTEEQCYEYIYWHLNIMRKCSKNGVPIYLHRNHRRVIEDRIAMGIRKYFTDYKKHEGHLLMIYEREGFRINRHMICKYPFLKVYLQH